MVRYLTTKGCQLCIYSKKSLKNTQWLQWFILVDVLLVTLSTILSALIFKAIFRTFLIETINLNCRFLSFFSFLPFLNFRAITFLTYHVPKKTSEGVKFTIYLLFFFLAQCFLRAAAFSLYQACFIDKLARCHHCIPPCFTNSVTDLVLDF